MTTPVVEYAPPVIRNDRTSLIALAVLGVVAVVLLLIGMGFLVGIWFCLFASRGGASRDYLDVFLVVLYAGAFGFFLAGAVCVWVCVRRLIGIMDR